MFGVWNLEFGVFSSMSSKLKKCFLILLAFALLASISFVQKSLNRDREKLGLTQKQFANLLGVGEATISRWESGAMIQSRAMDNFLRVFFAVPQARDALDRSHGMAQDFDKREEATEEVQKFGVAAIGLLRQAERTADPEVLRRCEQCLKTIEKVPTRTLAARVGLSRRLQRGRPYPRSGRAQADWPRGPGQKIRRGPTKETFAAR